MIFGATGWLFSPTRAPGWRPGGRGRESRIAECPLPCCQKVKRGARTPMPCGTQRRGSAPMSTARAEPHKNQDRVTELTPNKLALPVPKPGGANRPYPMACRIKQQRRRACLTTRLVRSQAGGFGQVDAEAAALVAVGHLQLRRAPGKMPALHPGAAASSQPPCRGRQRREPGTPTSPDRIDERRQHRTISLMKTSCP